MTMMQSYWYNNRGRTQPRFQYNQFAFIAGSQRYLHRRDRWYSAPITRWDEPEVTFEALDAAVNPLQERLDTPERLAYVRWLLSQDMTLSLLGVPRPQREEVERDYSGGIMKFIEDCLDAVFTRIPFWDNYFWQVYLRGTYTPSCCPEYLKQDNFERLKAGLTDRISIHTCTLTNFLQAHDVPISRVVLLDHMDWLSNVNRAALQQEWQSLIDHAEPGTRFLWRSGGLQVEYVDPIEIVRGGQRHRVGDLLTYYRDLATALHAQDRVHTYGSFYIADLKAA